MDILSITKRGVDRLRSGHPWIYRSDLASDPGGKLESGAAVELKDPGGKVVGTAFYSVHSQIALRVIARERVDPGRGFFAARIDRALALREALFPGERFTRLVHGEADLLPGLVVDRYGDHLSIQTGIPATESRKDLICDLLEERLRPAGIVERNDGTTRDREGLPKVKGVLRGAYTGPSEHVEGDVRMEIDLLEGQKTGAFLDQRENHVLAGRYARGRALDLFSYVGGFALQLARRAESVRAVEISAPACDAIRKNAERNGLTNVEAKEANAFDHLRDALAAGERFHTVVLDPPAFAKSKSSMDAAVRGYKEVNLRAIQLLMPGGVLVTCTCSYHVGPQLFEDTVLAAARDARRDVQVIERKGAARDHPELLGVPETRYLKCLVLRAA